MNLDALRFANFGKLKQAVDDWSSMLGKLEDLSEDAGSQLDNRAKKADWAGENATVTRRFVTKTAREFGDAVTQARSVRNILRDTHDELVGYKKELNDRIDLGVREKNLTVTDLGDGAFTVTMNRHPDRATGEVPDHRPADAVDLRNDIQRILKAAATSDRTAAEALTLIVDASPHGFNNAFYKDRDTAADAVRNGRRAARIAGKDPTDLTPEEFDELKGLLHSHKDDRLFAETFATKLTPKGALEFWAGLNSPHSEVGRARLDDLKGFQENLSTTLAAATQSDSPTMARWERDMVRLGDQPVSVARYPGPQGFQVMSNLMRWGDYDDRFLTDYGRELMKTEKARTNNGTAADRAWLDGTATGLLNRSGTDGGHDPVLGFMKALANSPDASTEFFNDTYLTKSEDHQFEDDGKKKSLTNFDYLFEERAWPAETTDDFEKSVEGHKSLAAALESATTGHPPGRAAAWDDLTHSKGQAELTKRLVMSVSEDPTRLTEHSEMSRALGRISAEYMPDINRSLSPDGANENNLYAISGADAELPARDVYKFLHTVGQDPDGYAAVTLGQHSYTASLMEYHFKNPGAYVQDANFPDSENLKLGVENIAKRSGEVQGILGAGRTFEIETSGIDKDQKFNDALDASHSWVSPLVGVGVGLATAPFTGPGGVVAGVAAETASEEILGMITEGSKRDSSEEVVFRNGERWDAMKESTYSMTQRAAELGSERSGNPSPHIVSVSASAAEQGFTSAATNYRNYTVGQNAQKDGQ
ncbi:hypothetical protein [Streptomyces sparsus]